MQSPVCDIWKMDRALISIQHRNTPNSETSRESPQNRINDESWEGERGNSVNFSTMEIEHSSASSKKRPTSVDGQEMSNFPFKATNYFKKSKMGEVSQTPFKEDCNSSTSSDDEKHLTRRSFTPNADSETSPTRSGSAVKENLSTTAAVTDTGRASPPKFFGYHPSIPMKIHHSQLNSTKMDQGSNQNQRNDFPTSKYFIGLKAPSSFVNSPEDENEHDEAGIIGSELLVAAYNNFVRKLVDETLDRTITFCEQPRHAISALERICAKAWPQLESKRHRNRIRAYLKACRRNSKKNRGQINMKEPPMNGLSVEARQMVSTALSLVTKDVEQLRQDLKNDQNLGNYPAKNGLQSCTSSGFRKSDSYYSTGNSDVHVAKSSLSGSGRVGGFTHDDKSHHVSKLTSSTAAVTSGPGCPTTLIPSPTAFGSTSPGFAHGLDQDCMSAMMRLFPTAFHLSSAFGSDFGAALRSAATQALMNPPSGTSDSSGVPGTSLTGLYRLPFSVPNLGLKQPSAGSNITALTPDNHNRPTFDVTECGKGSRSQGAADARSPEELSSFMKHSALRLSGFTGEKQGVSAPQAHFAAVRYSSTLNEATARLLDVRPLTQDDMAYFQHYQDIMHEALEYVKGVSQMLLKKAEILEGHFRANKSAYVHTPLNYSNNT